VEHFQGSFHAWLDKFNNVNCAWNNVVVMFPDRVDGLGEISSRKPGLAFA
jgi:hypothetical protein